MSGVNNNGLHSANGIAALFIATGQDAANVAESSAALGFSELLPNGDYYGSITLPSLIVATYGGGTGLATQRECLELLGCYGTGKVRKLAEIVAATVLCGELSLGDPRRRVGAGARRLRPQPARPALTGRDRADQDATPPHSAWQRTTPQSAGENSHRRLPTRSPASAAGRPARRAFAA
jgi:hypothetical protein